MSELFDDLWLPQPTATWARLVQDHDRIADRCAKLAALAAQPAADDASASALLLELAVLLADHLAVEDEVLDQTETAVAAGRSADDAMAMRVTLEALRRDWAVFVGRWTSQAVTDDWPAFCCQTELMMERLLRQIGAENDILYSPALGRGIIRRGAAPLH